MIKHFYVVCLAVGAITELNAQKISSFKVPADVKTAFNTRFPNKKPRWHIVNATHFEAEFRQSRQEITITFQNTGTWIETEKEIHKSELPVKVALMLINQFADFTIEECCMIENLQYGNCYLIEIENNEDEYDLYLSADGQILSQRKKYEE
jgi:hypothetical protein